MTEERRQQLDEQLDAAIASGDGVKIKAVRRTMEREILECTAHTAARIKRIEIKVEKLCEDWEALRHKMEGGRIALAFLKYLLSAVGGAGVLQLLANIKF